jgi:hypothetical protein
VSARLAGDVDKAAAVHEYPIPFIFLKYLKMKNRRLLIEDALFYQQLQVDWEGEVEFVDDTPFLTPFHDGLCRLCN